MTDYSVTSTCLSFDKVTQPSYNYDYSYFIIDHSGTSTHKEGSNSDFSGSVSAGFWGAKVAAHMSKSESKESTSSKKTTMIVTKMAMERFYESIDDRTATLTPNAMSLIKKKDLIGFFQACGSGFIRSVRRTNEIAAVFTFTSSSTATLEKSAQEFGGSVGASAWGVSAEASASHGSHKVDFSEETDLEIKIEIQAFGLGLNKKNASTLVARDMEAYYKALDYAFESFQGQSIGIVKGIEVVPWVDNLQFQNAVQIRSAPARGYKELTYEEYQKKCQECLSKKGCVDFNEVEEKCEGAKLKHQYHREIAIAKHQHENIDADNNHALANENGEAVVTDLPKILSKPILKLMQTANAGFIAEMQTQVRTINRLADEIPQCQVRTLPPQTPS